MGGPSIVIGLDFGTTFSGIAWALEGSGDEVEVMSQWPGAGNRTSLKVPSVILYTDTNTHWGYQVGLLTDAFRGIKLLLDEDQQTKYEPSQNTKLLLDKHKKDAVQVTGDYLGQLVRLTKQVLQRRFGLMAGDLNLRFILTVPAVWSDKAKDSTLRAAIAAGINTEDISLVSEPEAAALYALDATRPNSIGVDDVVIVCDAGGGTVDLISYQIKGLEPLRLVEVNKGDGAICGSMLLDQRFGELLKREMGESYASLPDKTREAAVTYWQDRVKPHFKGDPDSDGDGDFVDVDYYIPLPGAANDPVAGIEDGFFQLSCDDVKEIFEPIVQDVKDYVSRQIRGIRDMGLQVKAIILVGGFGSSEYLYNSLRAAYGDVTILQPSNAWSAVVSGAVKHGLEGTRVESRVARRHYGVVYKQTYHAALHSPDNKTWDPLEEEYKAEHLMEWYIKKHSKMCENTPMRMDFFRVVSSPKLHHLKFTEYLYFCNHDDAPQREDQNVMKLCGMEVDLSTIPLELMEKRKNSQGEEYFKIFFTIVMIPTSASLLFELEFNGVSSEEKPRHNKNAELGTKKAVFSRQILLSQEDAASLKLGEQVTLMNWGNAIVKNISPIQSGIVSEMEVDLHLEGDFKKTEKKLTWLAKEAFIMIPVVLFDFDYPITKDKHDKGDDLSSFVTPQSEIRTGAWADCNVMSLARDDIIQFDRIGFFRVDRAYEEGKPVVLFSIPTVKDT